MDPISIGSTILGFISKPLQSVLDKIIPDKNKQKEFNHELNMAVLNAGTDEMKLFAQRLIAEIKNPSFLRDAVRPIITYAAFGLYAYIKTVVVYVATKVYLPLITTALKGSPEQVYTNLPHIKGLLTEFKEAVFTEFDFYLLLTILSFWFGGKLLERFTEKVTGAGGVRALVFGK